VPSRFLLGLLLIGFLGFSPGCTLFKKPPKAKKVTTQEDKRRKGPPVYVGTVKLVNEEQHFILIDSAGQPSPTTDAVLKTRSGDVETAELKAVDIRRRPFAIADIVSGTPRVGDRVYQQGN
jgi:hypothetical protein